MLNKIKNEIRMEYKKNKVVTMFMVSILILSVLTYLKPSSTSGILNYLGITTVNFIFLTVVILIFWEIFIRKGGKIR